MSLLVSNVNGSAYNNPSFKKNKQRYKEKGVPCYTSHSALKVGGTLGVLTGLGAFLNFFKKDKLVKEVIAICKSFDLPEEALKNVPKFVESNKKLFLGTAFLAPLIHFASSIIVDKKRNEKSAEVARQIEQYGAKKVAQSNENLALSQNGNLYYESKTGAKVGKYVGAIAGVVTGAATYFKDKKLFDFVLKELPKDSLKDKINITKSVYVLILPIAVAMTAFGGWALGKLSDSIHNNSAYKNA